MAKVLCGVLMSLSIIFLLQDEAFCINSVANNSQSRAVGEYEDLNKPIGEYGNFDNSHIGKPSERVKTSNGMYVSIGTATNPFAISVKSGTTTHMPTASLGIPISVGYDFSRTSTAPIRIALEVTPTTPARLDEIDFEISGVLVFFNAYLTVLTLKKVDFLLMGGIGIAEHRVMYGAYSTIITNLALNGGVGVSVNMTEKLAIDTIISYIDMGEAEYWGPSGTLTTTAGRVQAMVGIRYTF